MDSIDADLFGTSIRGGGFQPSDESRHRCGGGRKSGREGEGQLLIHLLSAISHPSDAHLLNTPPCAPALARRRMRVAVHALLTDAYNADLADLEAHRDALAAAADAILKSEMLTGGWVLRGWVGALVGGGLAVRVEGSICHGCVKWAVPPAGR